MQEENTDAFPCIVTDTSFIASYVLNGFTDDEFSSCIKDIEYVLNNNGQFYVPSLFWYEIGNVLLYKTRSSKTSAQGIKKTVISVSDAMDIMYDLSQLPFYTDCQPDIQIRQRIFSIAREYNLSYYDASYLELSRRCNIPLKTYDEDLLRAIKE